MEPEDRDRMNSVKVDGYLYTKHPKHGWLRMSSYGWTPVPYMADRLNKALEQRRKGK